MRRGRAQYIFILVLLILAVEAGGRLMQAEIPKTVKIFNSQKEIYEELPKIYKTDTQWQSVLTPEQFRITRQHGTERAFTGQYHAYKQKGIYKCIACGTDLFSSHSKFDSGTGWPSFWQPIAPENVGYREDRSLFTVRTEVHCARCDAHLGHVFDDGPPPTGKRFCLNSAALHFVPAQE